MREIGKGLGEAKAQVPYSAVHTREVLLLPDDKG